jgi:hypothetical protein
MADAIGLILGVRPTVEAGRDQRGSALDDEKARQAGEAARKRREKRQQRKAAKAAEASRKMFGAEGSSRHGGDAGNQEENVKTWAADDKVEGGDDGSDDGRGRHHGSQLADAQREEWSESDEAQRTTAVRGSRHRREEGRNAGHRNSTARVGRHGADGDGAWGDDDVDDRSGRSAQRFKNEDAVASNGGALAAASEEAAVGDEASGEWDEEDLAAVATSPSTGGARNGGAAAAGEAALRFRPSPTPGPPSPRAPECISAEDTLVGHEWVNAVRLFLLNCIVSLLHFLEPDSLVSLYQKDTLLTFTKSFRLTRCAIWHLPGALSFGVRWLCTAWQRTSPPAKKARCAAWKCAAKRARSGGRGRVRTR